MWLVNRPHPLTTPTDCTPLHCRHLEWRNLEAIVNGDSSIDINNVTNGAKEHLDFHDRIIKVSLGWGHLIVTMPTQCYIYK